MQLGLSAVLVFILLVVKDVYECSLTLGECASSILDEHGGVILSVDLTDLDYDDRDGQVGGAQDLVQSVLEIIYHASHQHY